MVELKRRGVGNIHFEVSRALTIPFGNDSTALQKGLAIKERLELEGIKTGYASSSVRSLGVKTVVATLPSGIDDIDDWIRENVEKLLRFPVSLREFSYAYEFLRPTESRQPVEITFVRNADIEHCLIVFKSAGLELLSLGAGTRDAASPLMVDVEEGGDLTLCHFDGNVGSLTSITEGARSDSKTIVLDGSGLPGTLSELVREYCGKVLVIGEVGSNVDQDLIYRPFGLTPEYVLAAGLALKGLLPRISPTDFQSEKNKRVVQLSLQRGRFQRTALSLGSILILMLLANLIATFVIQSHIDALDEVLSSSSIGYHELGILEQQVKEMEGRLASQMTSTQYARVLHDLATVTPDSVWLKRVLLERKEDRRTRATITGSAKRATHVPALLKRLGNVPGADAVNLVRSGSPEQGGVLRTVARSRESAVTFEITYALIDDAR